MNKFKFIFTWIKLFFMLTKVIYIHRLQYRDDTSYMLISIVFDYVYIVVQPLVTLNMYVAARIERFIQLKLLVLQLTRFIIQSLVYLPCVWKKVKLSILHILTLWSQLFPGFSRMPKFSFQRKDQTCNFLKLLIMVPNNNTTHTHTHITVYSR